MNYLQIIKQYKSLIASSYKSITPEQTTFLPKGKLYLSRKYDGLFCCLILNSKDRKLLMPNGETVPKDSAIFKEIKNIEYDEEIIIAGELYSLKNDTERERYSDIHSALSQKKDDKIHFAAFDIIQGSSENLDIYSKKINLISKILQDSNYLHPIKIEETDAAQVPNFFDNIVVKGHSEGLVIRDDRRIFKMKQDIDLDLVVLGYTLQQNDSVRSIALGIVLSEKEYLHVGSVGTLGSDKKRKELFKQLSQHKCTNSYRMPASNGSLYQFVIPKLVVSVIAKDVQNERHDASPVTHMAFAASKNQLQPLHLVPSFSILHANLNEIRKDKKVNLENCGLNQFERAGFFIKDINTDPKKNILSMPLSVIKEKEVYVKNSKNGQALKKFIILETHKKNKDYPRYLFYYFDMSEKRKIPIKRDVRPFNDIKLAKKMMKHYLDKNIKKGWEKK
ncbi:hypothetical protein N9D82_02270 [Gammaproteobacteria bacterium]|nr:hypothetical protein [Gammaproteobacteria bacterium]